LDIVFPSEGGAYDPALREKYLPLEIANEILHFFLFLYLFFEKIQNDGFLVATHCNASLRRVLYNKIMEKEQINYSKITTTKQQSTKQQSTSKIKRKSP